MKKRLFLVLIPAVIGGLWFFTALGAKPATGSIALQFPHAKKHYQNLPGYTSTVFLQEKPFVKISLDTQDIPFEVALIDPFWLERSIKRQNEISQMPIFRKTREIHLSRFHSGGLKGQYRVSRIAFPDLGVKEIRRLTFAKYGDVCTVSFTYWEANAPRERGANSPRERAEIEKTWKSLLRQVGIDPADLPTMGGASQGDQFLQ